MGSVSSYQHPTYTVQTDQGPVTLQAYNCINAARVVERQGGAKPLAVGYADFPDHPPLVEGSRLRELMDEFAEMEAKEASHAD